MGICKFETTSFTFILVEVPNPFEKYLQGSVHCNFHLGFHRMHTIDFDFKLSSRPNFSLTIEADLYNQ